MQLKAIIKHPVFWWLARATIAAIIAGIWVWFSGTIAGIKYEFIVHEELVRFKGARPQPKDVVVVALDETSYRAFDLPMDRPIPREFYARLITRLKSLGAKRVVFDIVFAGHSQNLEWDEKLAESVSSMPVVLGLDSGIREDEGQIYHEVIKPDAWLAEKAEALGLVSMRLDDGVARQFLAEKDENVSQYVTLSEGAVGFSSSQNTKDYRLPDENDLIHYYGPTHSIKTFSIYQLLETEASFPRELIQDKVVFVGLVLRTALGANQKDSFNTPFGEIFGVEIHATMASNLLDGTWLKRPTRNIEIQVGSIFVFLGCLMVMILRPVQAAFFTVGIAALWILTSYTLLYYNYFLTGGSAVLAAIPLSFLIETTYSYLMTRRKQMEIERAFSHYLSPEMVKQLKKNPELLKLGGQELFATVIFTDIKGFTTITEKLGALNVSKMLNAYFSEVSKAILEEGGTVIKFIGDAVFALWGAPLYIEDHAARACRAAIKIQETVERFNALGNFPPLITRVGVNTGQMVVGNLGSDRRFDFTAIGDAVNLGARVEGINKYFGTTVLVTENTLSQANTTLPTIKMGSIVVAGKNEPVNVYRILREMLPKEKVDPWNQAVEAFSARDWGNAEKLFSDLKTHAEDFVIAADIYIETIERYKLHPPSDAWKGELTFDHK